MRELREYMKALTQQQLVQFYRKEDIPKHERAIDVAKKDNAKADVEKYERELLDVQEKLNEAKNSLKD